VWSPSTGTIGKLTEELDVVRRAWRQEGTELRARLVRRRARAPQSPCTRTWHAIAGRVYGHALWNGAPRAACWAAPCRLCRQRPVAAPAPPPTHPTLPPAQLEAQQSKIKAEERAFALESDLKLRELRWKEESAKRLYELQRQDTVVTHLRKEATKESSSLQVGTNPPPRPR
jgi:hypothetical protein